MSKAIDLILAEMMARLQSNSQCRLTKKQSSSWGFDSELFDQFAEIGGQVLVDKEAHTQPALLVVTGHRFSTVRQATLINTCQNVRSLFGSRSKPLDWHDLPGYLAAWINTPYSNVASNPAEKASSNGSAHSAGAPATSDSVEARAVNLAIGMLALADRGAAAICAELDAIEEHFG